jgi:hypothetical protein
MLLHGPAEEMARQQGLGYGGRELPVERPYLHHFTVLITTCERGDLRPSPNGIHIYEVDGVREIPVARGVGRPGQGDTLDVLRAAVCEGRPDYHNARWGKATLEGALAILHQRGIGARSCSNIRSAAHDRIAHDGIVVASSGPWGWGDAVAAPTAQRKLSTVRRNIHRPGAASRGSLLRS